MIHQWKSPLHYTRENPFSIHFKKTISLLCHHTFSLKLHSLRVPDQKKLLVAGFGDSIFNGKMSQLSPPGMVAYSADSFELDGSTSNFQKN